MLRNYYGALSITAIAYGASGCVTGTAGRLSIATHEVSAADARTLNDLLVGRFAGAVVVDESSHGTGIRIRGNRGSPLFVVDGSPIVGESGRLDFLNPHDIERIEVLKNPEDIALYGPLAASGVVRITTKRPGIRVPR